MSEQEPLETPPGAELKGDTQPDLRTLAPTDDVLSERADDAVDAGANPHDPITNPHAHETWEAQRLARVATQDRTAPAELESARRAAAGQHPQGVVTPTSIPAPVLAGAADTVSGRAAGGASREGVVTAQAGQSAEEFRRLLAGEDIVPGSVREPSADEPISPQGHATVETLPSTSGAATQVTATEPKLNPDFPPGPPDPHGSALEQIAAGEPDPSAEQPAPFEGVAPSTAAEPRLGDESGEGDGGVPPAAEE